ncbi:aspartate carbamoyltransferase catalytic subunit [Tropicibacter sp. S64]|uniref:aspartate carbamoyltransferase catalytic subunit n=1 Tax=Tropicibacter sp. S64 TaxID=3415122 RepID=UPI003C7CEE64
MRAAAQPAPPGWEGLLDPGEEILWQGRAGTGLSLPNPEPMRHVIGVFFVGFSLFWMNLTADIAGNVPGPVKVFPAFGLIFFFIGLWNAGLFVLWDAFKRSRTTYTLTNRRAFIATDLPVQGKTLSSYPIDRSSVLEFHGDDPGSIWFGERTVRTKNGSRTRRIGFEQIDDARTVYRLLRDIQQDPRSKP